MSVTAVQDSQPILAPGVPFAASAGEQAPFANQSDTPSFWDFVDAVNPLQHLPIVSTIYRAVTGDDIGSVPRIVGGMLYGGPLGLIGAVANEVVRRDTGEDLGEHALAMLFPGDAPAQETQVADAAAPPPTDMVMQAFDAVAADPVTAAAEPPPALPQPAAPVATAPLTAPMELSAAPPGSAQPAGAIAGPLFQPLSQPIDLSAAKAAQSEANAEPQAQAAAQPAKSAPLAAADTIVPQSPLLTAQLASNGDVQPMMIHPPAAAAGSAPAEPKTFAAKASPLGHGKMFASATPYLQKTDPAQKVAAAEGIPAEHPMLKAAGAGGADWMANAMSEALDKYSRTQKLLPAETAGGPNS